ncbi:hypothetical protein NDU88_004869, partial [Pleurodeles waltl]
TSAGAQKKKTEAVLGPSSMAWTDISLGRKPEDRRRRCSIRSMKTEAIWEPTK